MAHRGHLAGLTLALLLSACARPTDRPRGPLAVTDDAS